MKSITTEKDILNERENFPNTLFLAFNQASLRLRHLTQVLGYNLTGLSDCTALHINPLPSCLPYPEVKNGYYFSLETSVDGEANYTSKIHSSVCPNWESFDSRAVFPVHLLSRKGIVIQVWLKENENRKLITSWGINFSGLIPLCSKAPQPHAFGPNTLVFKLRGRYYTAYDCILNSQKCQEENLFQLHTGFCLALSETKPSYSVSSLCRLHSNKRDLKKQEQRRESLRESLEAKGVKNDSKRVNLQNEVENMKLRICLLMEQLEIEMNKLRSIKLAADNQDCENQDKGIELLEGYQNLNKLLSSFRSQDVKLKEECELLKDVVSKVKDRRCQLLSQLNLIFPLEKSLQDGVKYSICNIVLPNAESYEGHSEQSLSVALGYVSQLFVKIAFLINIPLKYPLMLRGSLSSISDLTSTQLLDVETQFPLYTRGKEKEKLHFNYGVFLLNKNIAQLRWNCGLSTSDLRLTLYNVWQFLRSLYDESFELKSFMPDTIVPSLVLPASLKQAVETPTTLLQHQDQRLPLNPLNPKRLQVLSDIPASPRNRFLKKNSLEDDFLCTASDAELLTVNRDSDDTQSDIDASADVKANSKVHLNSVEKTAQSNHQNVLKSKHTSFSLDQGINLINSVAKKESDFIRTSSLNAVPYTSSIPSESGSCPDHVTKSNEVDNDVPFPHFHEQTTQLLQSWHENYPSPYHSIIVASGSIEKLENVDTNSEILSSDQSESINVSINSHSVVDPPPFNNIQSEHSHINSTSKKLNCINTEVHLENKESNEIEKQHQNESQKIINSENLAKELGFNLDELEIEDDSFLEDVASRTANLASQNCSFKFSFSRPSDN